MVEIQKDDILQMDKIYRLNLVNSLPGYKPANLVGTRSREGISNLTIISSVVHLGSNPPLLGFILRPASVPRHTYTNIKETGAYTINHVHQNMVNQAHYTSAKFEKDISEFESCGLTELFRAGMKAPYVKESHLHIGMRFVEEYVIQANNTIFIVGEIESVFLPGEIVDSNGELDLNALEDVCISGLNNYHEVKQIAAFDYARPGQPPVNKI